MKCLFCTSEALPFAMSGGLGDVSGSLAHALRNRMVGCRIVMPLYKNIPENLKKSMKFITNFEVPVSWRKQYCGVFEAKYNGVIYYFIDNEYYFNRNNLYGFLDEAERFSFLSRAMLEMLPHINFKPDIIHCNDWQTALVAVYFDIFYSKLDFYSGIKTIFTIHNIEYQGKYGIEILNELIGIPENKISILEFDGHVNFMKGAIETANKVTTVSPTYSQEILNPWFSHGLDPILNQRNWKLSGILNGIDNDLYNPEKDENIYEKYSINTLTKKTKNKTELQHRLNLNPKFKIPLLGMITRMVEHKGIDIVINGLEKLLNETNIQFVILGSGDKKYEDYFKYIQNKYKGRVCSCFGFIPELAKKIYAASDMFLMPSKTEPCGLSQMIALRYGSIPIVRETGGLKDSIIDSQDGNGNGFRFSQYSSEDMINSIKRALKGYQDQEGWSILTKRAMQYDNSWNKSSNEYIKLYKSILN